MKEQTNTHKYKIKESNKIIDSKQATRKDIQEKNATFIERRKSKITQMQSFKTHVRRCKKERHKTWRVKINDKI